LLFLCPTKSIPLTPVSQKQLLVLFFIACEPGIKDIYSMVKVYERADYPFDLGVQLKALFDRQFVHVTKYLDNGTPALFAVTDKGKVYLDQHLDREALISYINSLQAPEFLLQVAHSCLEK
jgi:hypothetical protein